MIVWRIKTTKNFVFNDIFSIFAFRLVTSKTKKYEKVFYDLIVWNVSDASPAITCSVL